MSAKRELLVSGHSERLTLYVNPTLAELCYIEAIAIYRSNEHPATLDLANALRPLAILKDDAGEVEAAKRLWAEARDFYAAGNVQEGVAESSGRLTRLEARS